MNILILSWRGPNHPNAGGAEIVTMEHAKGWSKYGHNVTLFTSSFDDGNKTEEINGVKIIRSGGQAFGVKIRALYWYLFGHHEKFDLVIDEFHGLPFFTPLYVRTNKLAFIHEVAKNVWLLNPWRKPFNLIPAVMGTLFEPWIFKLVYRKTNFMVVSESTSNDLIAWGIPRKKITIIHNGVKRIIPIAHKNKESKFTITYLGALSQDKGLLYALEVFKSLNDKYPGQFNFWIIGSGEQKYIDLILTASKEVKIKYWGYVNENMKYKLLSKTHLLLNPSVREGWGLVVIEAASVGVPTVGFKVQGIKDSVIDGQTGLLATPYDVQELVSNIVRLYGDRRLLRRFQKDCLRRAKQFSWENSVRESLQLVSMVTR